MLGKSCSLPVFGRAVMFGRGDVRSRAASCAFVACVALAAIGATASSAAEPQRANSLREVERLRTSNSRTFAAGDGGFVTRIAARPVHYQTASGDWKAIDNRLALRNGVYSNRAGSFDAALPAGSAAAPVKLATRNSAVHVRALGARGRGRARGNTITYRDAYRHADLRYTVVSNGLKEDLVLRSEPARDTFQFALTAASGATADVALDGSVIVRDRKGVEYVIAAPFMVDDAGVKAPAHDARYALRKTRDGWLLTLALSRGWLAASARDYPVTVDPSMTIRAPWHPHVIDSTIRNGAYATTQLSSSSSLDVGRAADGTESRAALRFDLVASGVPAAAAIDMAYLRLSPGVHENAQSKRVDLHPLTQRFDATVTWNRASSAAAWASPGGDFDSFVESTATVVPNKMPYWDTTASVRRWHANPEDNAGVMLKDAPGQPINRSRFHSSDTYLCYGNPDEPCDGDSLDPELYVSWGSRDGDLPIYTFEERTLPDGSSLKVNVGNGRHSVRARDYATTDTAFDYAIDRASTAGGLFGNWRLPILNARLSFGWIAGPTDEYVWWRTLEGEQIAFHRRSDGTYGGSSWDYDAELVKTNGATGAVEWELRDNEKGHVWRFDAAGVPLTVSDDEGDRLTLTNAGGANPTITGPDGRITHIDTVLNTTDTNDPIHQVVAVRPPDGTRRDYRYSGRNLVSYDGPTGRTQYDYRSLWSAGVQTNVTKITAPNGAVTEVFVDYRAGRVTKIIEGGTKTTTFEYFDGYTVINHSSEGRRVYFYDRDDLTVRGIQRGTAPVAAPDGDIRSLIDGFDSGQTTATALVDGYDLEGVARVAIEIDGVERGSSSASCSGGCPKEFTGEFGVDLVSLGAGRHVARAIAVGHDGQVAASEPWSIYIDRSAPAAPSALRADWEGHRGQAQLSWTTGADPLLPGGHAGSGVAGHEWRVIQTDGTWSEWRDVDPDEPGFVSRASGSAVTFEARTIDEVGNRSTTTRATVTVSSGPPPTQYEQYEVCPTGEAIVESNVTCYATDGQLRTADASIASAEGCDPAGPQPKNVIKPGTDNAIWQFNGTVNLWRYKPASPLTGAASQEVIAKVREEAVVNFSGRQARINANWRLLCDKHGKGLRGLIKIETRYAEPNHDVREVENFTQKAPASSQRTGTYRVYLYGHRYRMRIRFSWDTCCYGGRRAPLIITHRIECTGKPRTSRARCRFDPLYPGRPR